jgi:alpha-D-ribose 1-methylphosphonate 5-triphosphate synthase subunit PhnG
MVSPDDHVRQNWMRVLALASWDDLKLMTADISATTFTFLRRPETGLIMLRGRMGGTGAAFNVGEATITRCSIKLGDNTEGHAFVLGRNADHARVAALCDGLLQQPAQYAALLESLIEPLRQKMDARRLQAREKAAATRVDFFTLVRGDA